MQYGIPVLNLGIAVANAVERVKAATILVYVACVLVPLGLGDTYHWTAFYNFTALFHGDCDEIFPGPWNEASNEH